MLKPLLLAATAVLATAPAAHAAEYLCQGTATGPAGQVLAFLVVDEGKIVRGRNDWLPRIDPSSMPGAQLVVQRPYSDPQTGVLGPVSGVQVVNQAMMNPPQTDKALVAVSSNTVPPIGKFWQMYANAAAAVKAGPGQPGAPAGAVPVMVVGSVPFGRDDPRSVALLDSLATANTVITSVSDEKGTVLISRGLFWLNDRPGAEALNRQAFGLAKEAAAAPQTQCKPNTPG